MQKSFLVKIFSAPLLRTYIVFQLISRILISLYSLQEGQISLSELPGIFIIGFLSDIISLCYFVPIISFIALIFRLSLPVRIYSNLAIIGYSLVNFILLFTLASQVVFWDEFGTNFNFIAVDYLIYTNEIIGTLKESLPLYEIIIGMVLFSLVITLLQVRRLKIYIAKNLIADHALYIAIFLPLALVLFKFYSSDRLAGFSHNRYAEEISKNGPYEFFAAFYNNSLNYNRLYKTIDNNKAYEITRKLISRENETFLNGDSILRHVKSATPFRKANVVLIVVESLSAEFMGKFGNSKGITPNLDRLADEGIFFTNLYAVGTRTVRGLEAITLSVPPTPGSSIVRRPDNQNLFNLGSVFKKYDYDVSFVYGGYSYFDNLENYFSGNGYRILDRGNLKSHEISFANIWGVADEDIYFKSIEMFDEDHAAGRPFFSLIMTTSNHRPYTFPEGRIDLPSGGGRAAAVKYTDYAIARFIEVAKTKPWFNNTLFAITADHCASSAGKVDLPVNKYHIPMIIYAPQLASPKVVNSLASQIDIAPTILALLGFEYDSKFFGSDILSAPSKRAFISTYQLLGYMKDGHLAILAPNFDAKIYDLTEEDKKPVAPNHKLLDEAIGFYQTAYDMYIHGKMRDDE